MPTYNVDEKWLKAAIESVTNQIYTKWELCIVDDCSTNPSVRNLLKRYKKDPRIKIKFLLKNEGIAAASNHALSLATGDYVGFLDHDDELYSNALYEMTKELNKKDWDAIYSDEDKIDLKGNHIEPHFKPNWSQEFLYSNNYVAHFTIYKKSLLDSVGGFRKGFEGSQDHDLILRVSERTQNIGHIPKILYGWRKIPGSAADSTNAKRYAYESGQKAVKESLERRGNSCKVDNNGNGTYHITFDYAYRPLVSIIIPTKNNVSLLQKCVSSIDSLTSYKNYEIIIVSNKSKNPKMIEFLKKINHKVIYYNDEFNFSRLNNFGAKNTKGHLLLFLNDDIEIFDSSWLDELVQFSTIKETGIVGSLLIYPPSSGIPNTIQHGGVIIGVCGTANHAFKYQNVMNPKYFNYDKNVRNVSAVTGACLMIKKEIFEKVNGFDPDLKIAYGDVDLCLRVLSLGYSVLINPYSRLYHYEGMSRGKNHLNESTHPKEDEILFLKRWENFILDGDPYYNPHLSSTVLSYEVSPSCNVIKSLNVLLEIYWERAD